MAIRYKPILGAQLDSFVAPGPLSIQWKEYDKGEGQYPDHDIPGLLPTYGTSNGQSVHHLMEEDPKPDGLTATPDRTVFDTTRKWTIAEFIQVQAAIWERDNKNRADIVQEIIDTPAIFTEGDPSYEYIYRYDEAAAKQGITYSDPVDISQVTYGHYITEYNEPTFCVTSCGIRLSRTVKSVTKLRREQASITKAELNEYPELVPKYEPFSTVVVSASAYVGQPPGPGALFDTRTYEVDLPPWEVDYMGYAADAIAYVEGWKSWLAANSPTEYISGLITDSATTMATPAGAADWGFTEPSILRAAMHTGKYQTSNWGDLTWTVSIVYRYGPFIEKPSDCEDLDSTFASTFFKNGFRSKGALLENTPMLTDSIQMRAPDSAYHPSAYRAEQFKRQGIISIIELQEGSTVTPFECFIADCVGRELPLNKDTGNVCDRPFDGGEYPPDLGIGELWPSLPPIVIPETTFLLQDGAEEPLYPTMYGAFVYDTHLKKWGKYSGAFKQLLDYSPVNSPQNGIQSYAKFGILGGIVDPNGTIRLFDTEPVRSRLVVGKFGYTRQGMTSPEEVRVHMRIPCTGSIQLNTSIEGKVYTLSLNQLQSFTNAVEATLYGGYSGRWHNVVLEGKYDVSYLEFRGISQGNR